jgi:hypothetical protein
MTKDPRTLAGLLKSGKTEAELRALEAAAMGALFAYEAGELSVEATLDAVLAYDANLERNSHDLTAMRDAYRRTLSDRPWEQCTCAMCGSVGINTLIFRGANRNKRRGAHNTWRLFQQVRMQQKVTATLGY